MIPANDGIPQCAVLPHKKRLVQNWLRAAQGAGNLQARLHDF